MSLKHRLNPKTIAKEAFGYLIHKTLPQGADEIANVLFSGSSYLPWPAHGGPLPQPEPDATPAPPEPTNFDVHVALYGVSYTDHPEGGIDR